MNFFGHATVACWYGDDPAWVLGSMVPDFCSMARTRLAGADHDALARGVAFHHRTDDVFHGAPTFLDLCREGSAILAGRGVRRGTAMACAHVGVELLLDGWLLSDDGVARSYVRALSEGAPDRLGRRLRFRSPDGHERFERLRRRLAGWGRPDGYDDPAVAADRLERALSPRPRLAIADAERPAVGSWMEANGAEVARRAPSLLGEVRCGLAERPGGPPP